MKARKRSFKKFREDQNFWPSFTDMISTIALILFFLMILAYVQNIVTGSNLEYARRQLQDTQQRLEASNLEISQAEDQLRLLTDRVDEIKAEVEDGEIALRLSELQIEDQSQIIAESNRELGNLRSRLQGIAVLRLDVLNRVKDSVEEEMARTRDRRDSPVYIADNGNIVIDEELVFDLNSYQIKPAGRQVLDELAMAFENILRDPEVRVNIDAINIQGHTDDIGSAEYNRNLSANRSVEVVNYLLNSNPTLENRYASYFMASAYSKFRPIASNATEANRAQNRRIEISIILKDSNIQEVINEYLADSMNAFMNE
ncbi:OmpA/MotB domain protein [Alkaliphilus metalliredigens QYMF]|uniref:OmpA/MotB domain protein n=1 Tax=Alkaliphilus metalliredigens (strain QYMF) TaxID=293826 RepID=A6TKJ6_ALKMQ|nr:OmpA family protein [Alkaliphilus metalliredigens]ABR46714.1 OmpA/MotB domain protein [Alkaliphilus metalliredigens QYMF]